LVCNFQSFCLAAVVEPALYTVGAFCHVSAAETLLLRSVGGGVSVRTQAEVRMEKAIDRFAKTLPKHGEAVLYIRRNPHMWDPANWPNDGMLDLDAGLDGAQTDEPIVAVASDVDPDLTVERHDVTAELVAMDCSFAGEIAEASTSAGTFVAAAARQTHEAGQKQRKLEGRRRQQQKNKLGGITQYSVVGSGGTSASAGGGGSFSAGAGGGGGGGGGGVGAGQQARSPTLASTAAGGDALPKIDYARLPSEPERERQVYVENVPDHISLSALEKLVADMISQRVDGLLAVEAIDHPVTGVAERRCT
jgi:uncharacterized membrane protein YgcG